MNLADYTTSGGSTTVEVDTSTSYVCEQAATDGCADLAFYSTSPTGPFECSTHRLPQTTPHVEVAR